VSIGALTRLPSRQDYQVAIDPWRETPASPLMRWLLGHRFLVASQRGRVSMRLHRTVVEVLRFD